MLGVLLGIGFICYAALIGYVVYREKTVPAYGDYDSIIVLGAQVQPNGDPSVQLEWRLRTAAEMYFAAPCPVVVCGARGKDEPRPEAEVMRDLLIQYGVPEADILVDATSQDTYENVRNAKTMINALGLSTPLIITSDYHLPRAMAIAQWVGFHPQGVASPTRQEISFWLKNHGREALAWVKFVLVRYAGLPL